MSEEQETDIGKEIDDAITSMEVEEKKEGESDAGDGEENQIQKDDVGDREGDKESGGEDEGEASAGDDGERSGADGSTSDGDGESGDAAGEATLDSGLLARAVSMGLTLTEAQGFTDDSALGGFLQSLSDNAPAAEQAPVVEVKKEDEEQENLLDSLPDLDPEVYGKEAIDLFGKLINHAKAQQEELNGIRAEQTRAAGMATAANGQDVEKFFDDSVAGLGEEFKETLGEGGVRSVPQGSAQYAKREAIAQEMTIRFSGYEAQGLTPPPREEVFSDAARFVLADEYAAIEKRKLSDELGARSGQHIQRGSSARGGSKISPEQETADLLKDKFGL